MFRSADSTVEMQLTQDFLKLNCVKYTSFEDLMVHIKKITSLLSNDVPVIGRLGLRYINQIGVEGVNPTEWNNYISDYLTLPAAQWAGDEKDSIVNTVGQVIFDYKDSMMNFNYGINAQALS